jgi:CubicO group peptidase (beta-lactamase class C family)
MQHARSNTDNIVVGLIVEAVTGQPYKKLLSTSVIFGPAKLRQTTFATALALSKPFIHGYVVDPPTKPQDVSQFLSRARARPVASVLGHSPQNLDLRHCKSSSAPHALVPGQPPYHRAARVQR